MDLWEKKKSGNVFENFFIFKFHLKPYPKGARVEGVQGSEIQKIKIKKIVIQKGFEKKIFLPIFFCKNPIVKSKPRSTP